MARKGHYFAAAAVLGPEKGIRAAVTAADQAQAALAFELAETHLRRALWLIELLPPCRARAEQEFAVQRNLAALVRMVYGIAEGSSADAWARCQTPAPASSLTCQPP